MKSLTTKQIFSLGSVLLLCACAEIPNDHPLDSDGPNFVGDDLAIDSDDDGTADFYELSSSPSSSSSHGVSSSSSLIVSSSSSAQIDSTPVYLQWHEFDFKGYRMAIRKTEITVGEYFRILGKDTTITDSLMPMQNISFREAAVWCNMLSDSMNLNSAYDVSSNIVIDSIALAVRLPTAAEWVYAAQAGDTSYHYPWGSTWNNSNANAHIIYDATKPNSVASLASNKWDLFDMLGNVKEWTQSGTAIARVVKGGSYLSGESDYDLRFESNENRADTTKHPSLGFRPVRVIEKLN